MQSQLSETGTEPPPASSRKPEPPSHFQSGLRRKLWWRGLVVAIVCGAFTTSLWLAGRRKAHPVDTAAPSSLIHSDSPAALRMKGTTQAVETRAILAPLLAGEQEGTLTITSLKAAGATVKRGDLLVEFDRQTQLRDFIDKQAQNNKQVDDVLQEQAKESAARAKDETEIMVAEGALGKARLEIQKVELLSRIDAEKAQENLEEATATLGQLKETFDLKRKAAQASIRILEIQRDRTKETMLHAQANAALMQVRSPIDGIVVLNTIWKQGSMGEVQEGDQVRPGVPFMQVVDPSSMEVQVSINQQDVLAFRSGQQARVHLDAYPDLVCPGQLQTIDPMGKSGDFSSKVRTFSALFSIQCTDKRLMPGLSAAVDMVPAATHDVAGIAR